MKFPFKLVLEVAFDTSTDVDMKDTFLLLFAFKERSVEPYALRG